MQLRTLRIAAGVEACSLVLLVLNLATVHVGALASALGPVHGCAYLVAIVMTWSLTKDSAARAFSVIPGFGAMLALRRLRSPESWEHKFPQAVEKPCG
ncbi:hypothetical protein GCM10022223_26010 [Kineosporia mesophila]|uniref:DUF3817 domain-containing protein n=1 Tax=Kineosporia mesophila TaxID=566012 RepID=A0ABP6ZIE7_9ACTN|nr:hypothetical protein [Kineosporia mesophila]MCD5350514.1 hypothetical protein [Kineosporia mesophila]